MSYGIIRLAKFNSSAVRGIQIHDEREKDKSHSNPDIDFTKSEENYSLKERPNKKYNQVIKERIDSLELKKAVRKDAVVMCSFVVTSDKDFFNNNTPETEKEYFKQAYEFIKNRYGEQNIISAEVHKDETTPHLHINFIPITEDNKLSAKRLFDKKSLKLLQDDFHRVVAKNFNLERGGIEEHQKNIDKVTYKKEKVKNELEEINKLEQDIEEKKQVILKKAHNVDKIYNNADYKELKKEDFKAQIIKKGIIFDTVESNDQILERINNRIKPLFEKSKLADVLKKEYDILKKSFENLKEQFKQVKEELSKYKDFFKELKPEQVQELSKQADKMREQNREQERYKKQLSREKTFTR